ncbi:MAG: hypothetical protein FD149_1030 [Rhodospirillaceae bacterium]|nr:MAG: hypothetical protein FD149_1030 [Rhodospirillaceae bacterium]
MKCFSLYGRDNHRCLAFGQDPSRSKNLIDTNQMVVVDEGVALLLDPGGVEIFPHVIAALTREVAIDTVHHIFISHQDPDTGSSLALWRRVCPSTVKIYLSWMWTGFVSHYDGEANFTAIPDQGMEVTVGRSRLRILPAHYLHSPGNFHVYDPKARILFSGDVGAALLPDERREDIFVRDFTRHTQYMDGFHRRWMGSPKARDALDCHGLPVADRHPRPPAWPFVQRR